MNKDEVIAALKELLAKGELLIFNPETSNLVDDGIESVCLNGPAVQITLTKSATSASKK